MQEMRVSIHKTDREIIEGMSGVQNFLKCRWDVVNRSMLGGWRFNNNYLLAGLSGHGKSWILNLLMQDFANKELNSEFHRDYKMLHFGFEMSASDEILRQISSFTRIPYEDLISANRKLTDIQYKLVKEAYKKIENTPIWIVEEPGTVQQLYFTIEEFNKRFPTSQLVITIDHSLLTKNTYSSEIELLAELAKMFMKVRKTFGAMCIILGQLNGNIEKDERLSIVPNKRFLHFPKKSDIHGSAQMYHAADFVIVVHQPRMLGIEIYGEGASPTEDLIAWHLIKARKGTPKFIRLKQDLNHGNIIQWN